MNGWYPFQINTTATSTAASPDVLASVTSPRNTLSNDYGGMDLYVNQFGLQDHDAFYTNDQILTAFQIYTKQIVLRYLNSPAVFSWELANDATYPLPWNMSPRHVSDCNGTLPTSPTCTTQTVTKWHAEMAAFIASIDFVSAGTSGYQCTDCPKLYPITPTASPTPSPAPGKKRNQSFGSYQVFPDQNLYAPDDPNLSPVQNKTDSSLTWIQQSAQSAAAVGKPVVLNAFGLATQSNLNDFVPFILTYAHYASDTAVTDVTARSGFAVGNSAGLAGVMQYQWSSTGITQTSSTIQLDELDTTNSPAPGATTVASPNDGYSIANNPAIQQVLRQGAQAMAQNS
ncbi:glycoside hydrolase superfamily [Suillus ampliporus]|nr:glycoside hydrolase superfamily [Suillus ampliporus]